MNYLNALTDTLHITSVLLENGTPLSVSAAKEHLRTAQDLCEKIRHPKAIQIMEKYKLNESEC